MKKFIYVLVLLFVLGVSVLNSQESKAILKTVRISTNAINDPTISIEFELDLQGEKIDPDYWITNGEAKPKFSIQYADLKSSDCPLQVLPTVFKEGFGFRITGFSESTLRRFLNRDKDNQIKLVIESDIRIGLVRDEEDSTDKFLLVESREANLMMTYDLEFTDEEKSDFLTALNNFYYHENMVDFGINPGRDTSRSDYVLSIRFQNAYNKKRFLACDPKTLKNKPMVYWSVDTRLSTDFSDSLTYVNFYPVNILLEDFSGKLPYQLNFKFGNESSQDFINKRVAIDGEFNFIIPNLVNLTTAHSNRLRLKPVLSLGMKAYYDYSNGIDAFVSGQAYFNGHYYIPVFNNYVIIVDGGAFYDLSNQRNPGKKLQGNYSITLGAEIPKTGFKAMFKFIDGKTDINFSQGSIISIGLLMDFFNERNQRGF